jgi:hypothetical protein
MVLISAMVTQTKPRGSPRCSDFVRGKNRTGRARCPAGGNRCRRGPHIGGCRSKLPLLRHPVKGGMPLERAHVARKQSEANRAAAVAVIDAVDQGRQFLAPGIIRGEQVWLAVIGGHQVEQHHAHADRLITRHMLPELPEAREQESSVAGLVEIGFVPEAAKIGDLVGRLVSRCCAKSRST